jgi:hypothetical protein
MRLIGLRDFARDNGFPGLGMNTTLICLQLMGMYPKAKLALSNISTCLKTERQREREGGGGHMPSYVSRNHLSD